ncbi:hypothetical protein [Arthrobacter sp. efr-133-TYG-104]|uniref:hypothetical protein n=1 Tax=Arthrobacter sp. efr-133-TYG-104 TaxID=3040324 RepID=UPI00254DB406|nr:hypothetical protein [Arthrobacter sp. efr-133-TYG-104]
MAVVVGWISFPVGLLLLIWTWTSVIGALIVPRQHKHKLSAAAAVIAEAIFSVARRPIKTYRKLDRLLAWQAPMQLFIRLGMWMMLLYLSFALMLLPFVQTDPYRAFSEAGSALFTLGYAAPDQLGNTALVYSGAFTGLVVIALQVGYLPTLYAAFNRRESEVSLLLSRAGSPAWGPELLIRTRFGLSTVDSTAELGTLYGTWERWAADVAESHTTYLTLCMLRSPLPESNWLTALLSVMDSAALQLSLSPGTAPTLRARLMLRMGFSCLNQIAGALSIPVVEDVNPDDDTELTFEEFSDAVQMLRDVGYPVEHSAERAWPHFRGWRLNYESVAYRLAYAIDAPPALWSGPRRLATAQIPPKRPANRIASDARPEDPQRDLRGPIT